MSEQAGEAKTPSPAQASNEHSPPASAAMKALRLPEGMEEVDEEDLDVAAVLHDLVRTLCCFDHNLIVSEIMQRLKELDVLTMLKIANRWDDANSFAQALQDTPYVNGERNDIHRILCALWTHSNSVADARAVSSAQTRAPQQEQA